MIVEYPSSILIPYDDRTDAVDVGLSRLEDATTNASSPFCQSVTGGTTAHSVGGNTTVWNMTSNTTEAACEPEWHIYVKIVCVPLLAALGLVGNTLSFLVMFAPTYKRKSYSYYLRGLAIFDSLTLIIAVVEVGNDISYISTGHGYLRAHNTATCKLSEFLRHVTFVMSSWTVVCFTVDRYIAVCHPLQRARLCTERSAKISLVVLLLLAMTSQLYLFHFISRLDRDPDKLPCHAPTDIRILYFGVEYFGFSFMLRFLLPFAIIVVLNGCIIYHINRMRNSRVAREKEKIRNANLAICTLFLVCAVFVVTLLPNAVISMVMFLGVVIYESNELYCPLFSVDIPCQMVRLVNYAVNFVLYGLSGRRFRRELQRLPTMILGWVSRERENGASQSYKLQYIRPRSIQ